MDNKRRRTKTIENQNAPAILIEREDIDSNQQADSGGTGGETITKQPNITQRQSQNRQNEESTA